MLCASGKEAMELCDGAGLMAANSMKPIKSLGVPIYIAFFLGGIAIAIVAAYNNNIPLDFTPENIQRLIAPFLVGSISASAVVYFIQAKQQILLNLLEVERTERGRLEVAVNEKTSDLMESKERFKALSDASYGGIIIHEQGVILECNKGLSDITGFSTHELIGMDGFKLIAPAFLDIVLANIKRGLDERYDVEGVRKDGTKYPLAIRGKNIPYKGHDVRVIEFRDITKDYAIQEDLNKAKIEAEIANRAKSDFLASMSHDLRTPLNAIMGFSEIIQTEAFGALGNKKYCEYAGDIHGSGELLVSLINDILDISKIEAGKYKLNNETVDIHSAIDVSIRQLSRMAESAKLTINIETPSHLPYLHGDERVLIQILNNILSNAIKFTPEKGTITITAVLDITKRIIISFQDTGIGMAKEDITKALKPFEQTDSQHSRRHEGTGLGLHLCVNFMKLFGGALDITSKEGIGTKIVISFPSERTIKKMN